jgi:hypothetical protein
MQTRSVLQTYKAFPLPQNTPPEKTVLVICLLYFQVANISIVYPLLLAAVLLANTLSEFAKPAALVLSNHNLQLVYCRWP